jgi:hypothetical protein
LVLQKIGTPDSEIVTGLCADCAPERESRSPARTSHCDTCFGRGDCHEPAMSVEHEAEV